MLQKKIFFYLFLIILFSCKSKELNYINYYNTAYDIDSIYRYKKDTVTALKLYKKLFKKFPPKNTEKLQEYETYITLSDKLHKNFGGKKSLYKLIPLVAPYWKYRRQESSFFALYDKYGIDSLKLEQRVGDWKKSLNKQLVDSFSIAFLRDQRSRTAQVVNFDSINKDDAMNLELLLWTFKNSGYPSMQKIGLFGNNDTTLSMTIMLNHMSNVREYSYLKTKLLEYVRSGDCPPRDYIEMIERYNEARNLKSEYGVKGDISDTVKINRNRKLIGFPSYDHWKKITKGYWKNEREKK